MNRAPVHAAPPFDAQPLPLPGVVGDASAVLPVRLPSIRARLANALLFWAVVRSLALGADGRMLYVAQTRAERVEAEAEVALSAALATLATGLVGMLWLRARVRR